MAYKKLFSCLQSFTQVFSNVFLVPLSVLYHLNKGIVKLLCCSNLAVIDEVKIYQGDLISEYMHIQEL